MRRGDIYSSRRRTTTATLAIDVDSVPRWVEVLLPQHPSRVSVQVDRTLRVPVSMTSSFSPSCSTPRYSVEELPGTKRGVDVVQRGRLPRPLSRVSELRVEGLAMVVQPSSARSLTQEDKGESGGTRAVEAGDAGEALDEGFVAEIGSTE